MVPGTTSVNRRFFRSSFIGETHPPPRQYDFRDMRLTSSAQRGVALEGQSRPGLSAHYERGLVPI